MQRYLEAAWERTMKVQEVILPAMAKRIQVVASGGDSGDFGPEPAALEAAV